jgi:hypothetical protein
MCAGVCRRVPPPRGRSSLCLSILPELFDYFCFFPLDMGVQCKYGGGVPRSNESTSLDRLTGFGLKNFLGSLSLPVCVCVYASLSSNIDTRSCTYAVSKRSRPWIAGMRHLCHMRRMDRIRYGRCVQKRVQSQRASRRRTGRSVNGGPARASLLFELFDLSPSLRLSSVKTKAPTITGPLGVVPPVRAVTVHPATNTAPLYSRCTMGWFKCEGFLRIVGMLGVTSQSVTECHFYVILIDSRYREVTSFPPDRTSCFLLIGPYRWPIRIADKTARVKVILFLLFNSIFFRISRISVVF